MNFFLEFQTVHAPPRETQTELGAMALLRLPVARRLQGNVLLMPAVIKLAVVWELTPGGSLDLPPCRSAAVEEGALMAALIPSPLFARARDRSFLHF